MRIISSQEEKIEELTQNLKEPSFKAFIHWKGELCSISDFSMLKSLVLPCFAPDYNFSDLVEDLKDLKLRFRLKNNRFQIIFPKKFEIVREHSKNFLIFSDKLGQIESKQIDLTQALARTHEKIQKAILINERIREELRNSKERQEEMLRELGEKLENQSLMKRFLN